MTHLPTLATFLALLWALGLDVALLAAAVASDFCGVFSATYLYMNDVLISSTKVSVIVRGSLTLLVFGSFFFRVFGYSRL